MLMVISFYSIHNVFNAFKQSTSDGLLVPCGVSSKAYTIFFNFFSPYLPNPVLFSHKFMFSKMTGCAIVLVF